MFEYWLIPIAFLTSTLAAVFGMGGGVPLITLMPGFVPVAAIIPIHGVTQLASNGSRALFGWREIDWRLIPPLLIGAIGGAMLGGQLYELLALEWLPLIIGMVILLITWVPLPGVRGQGHWPLVLLGFYQTGLGMLVGATGPLGAAVMAGRSDRRDWLVVNTAVYMSVNHLIRLFVFGFLGFAFAQYWQLILGMVVGVILGSWVGTRLRQFVPEGNFQFWFKVMITLLATRMIGLVLWEQWA